MSKRLYFINDKQEEVRTLIRLLTWEKIIRECLKRGLPEPTNANNFCIIVSKGRLELCYKYFKRPTIIMNLSPNELPHKGWRVYVG